MSEVQPKFVTLNLNFPAVDFLSFIFQLFFFYILYLFFFRCLLYQFKVFYFLVSRFSCSSCRLTYAISFIFVTSFFLSLRLNRGRAVNWERRGHSLRQLLHFLLPLHSLKLECIIEQKRFLWFLSLYWESNSNRVDERETGTCLSIVCKLTYVV